MRLGVLTALSAALAAVPIAAFAWLPHGTAGSGCTSGPCTVQLPLSIPSIVKPPISSVVRVHSGGNPQTALNAATPGTAIIFDAGATFTGAYTLPNTSCGGGWITLESSGSSTLIPGVRVAPAQVASMATFTVPTGNQSSFSTNTSACNYWIDGVEIYEPGSATVTHAMVSIGTSLETTMAQFPQNIVMDRDYVHGSTTLDLTHAIRVEGINQAIINSNISEIHSAVNDSQAIFGTDAPGPTLIQNDDLEASGENTLFGGGDPSIVNLIPSDITVQNNLYFKPPAWLGVWDIKNLFELKIGNRVLAQWNLLENNWLANQTGSAFLLKSANQNFANWTETSNVTIQDNVINNVVEGLSTGSCQVAVAGQFAVAMNNLNINNNLFYNIGPLNDAIILFINGSTVCSPVAPMTNFWAQQNTFVTAPSQPSTYSIGADNGGGPTDIFPNFNFDNNIYITPFYDVKYTAIASGAPTLNAITNNGTQGTFTGNVDVGGVIGNFTGWTAGNSFPASITFVNPADGDYRVAGGLYPGAGSQVIAPQTPNCSSTSGIRSQYLGQPVLIFTANDTLVCTAGFTGHVMLVGGGAGGGCLPGGAGVYSDNPSVSIPSGSTAITVGAGGSAGNCSTSTAGGSGGSSSFNGLSAAGGAYNGGGTGTSNQITGTPVNYGCPGGSTPGSACSADVGTLNSTAAAALNPQAGTGDGAGDTTASFTGTAGAVGTVIITCADERTC